MVKLSASKVKGERESRLAAQGNLCGLCSQAVNNDDIAHLDHDHKTGSIRKVLHKDCNILLGKIENYSNRMGKKIVAEGRLEDFLKNAFSYLQDDYSANPIHHTHKRKK